MSERYYHFTAKHLAYRIYDEGLTLGAIVVPSLLAPMAFVDGRGIRIKRGYQWLTTNPTFKQEWCNPKYSTLSYSRNAVRFSIEIPAEYADNIVPSKDVEGFVDLGLGDFGDPENWYVYKGKIPAGWIVAQDFLEHEKRGGKRDNV